MLTYLSPAHEVGGAILFAAYLVSVRFVSIRYLENRELDCFPIAHTHSIGGVDVLFGGYDL